MSKGLIANLARRASIAGLALLGIVTVSCRSDRPDARSRAALSGGRTDPIPVPPNTILPIEPNAYSDGIQTDSFAADADVGVGADGSLSVHVPIWVSPG